MNSMSSFHTHIPFVELLGMELLKFEDGEAEIALTLREELCNSWSVAHGGVTMTLLDVVMAHAARRKRVHHRVHQRGGRADGAGLAAALRAERVVRARRDAGR